MPLSLQIAITGFIVTVFISVVMSATNGNYSVWVAVLALLLYYGGGLVCIGGLLFAIWE